MTDWIKSPFTEAIDYQEGPGILAKDFRDAGVPLVRLSGLDEGASVLNGCNFLDPAMVQKKWRHFALAEGDILLSTSASLGRVITVQREGAGAIAYTGIMRMRPRDKRVFPPFIRYLLASPEFQQQAVAAGAGSVLKHFGPMHLQHMHVHLPSLSEQEQITTVLSTIDAKIDLNNRINAELEALAKTIYDYWFVQFDFPDAKGRPYKTSGGKMVWNETLKREIPAGWEVRMLGTVISRAGTGLNPRDNFVLGSGNNYYVTIKNVTNGRIVLDEKCDRIDDESMAIIDRRSQLRAGDVLFTSIEPVGVTYLIHEKPTNWNINESVFTLRPDADVISSEYLFMLLSSSEMKAFTKNSSAGSIHKGIRHAVLKSFTLAYSGRMLVDQFSSLLRPMLQKMDNLDKENRELIQLRDWLLPLLMNGQVRVA